MKISREYIAQKLKLLREQAGLTVYQVGEIVGKSGKTVSAWENNHGQPDAEMLMKLCDVYNVDDILAEFRDKAKKTEYFHTTEFERILIEAYRNHPEMHNAINKMLDIDDNIYSTNNPRTDYARIAAKGQGTRKHPITDEQRKKALRILHDLDNESDDNI